MALLATFPPPQPQAGFYPERRQPLGTLGGLAAPRPKVIKGGTHMITLITFGFRSANRARRPAAARPPGIPSPTDDNAAVTPQRIAAAADSCVARGGRWPCTPP